MTFLEFVGLSSYTLTHHFSHTPTHESTRTDTYEVRGFDFVDLFGVCDYGSCVVVRGLILWVQLLIWVDFWVRLLGLISGFDWLMIAGFDLGGDGVAVVMML